MQRKSLFHLITKACSNSYENGGRRGHVAVAALVLGGDEDDGGHQNRYNHQDHQDNHSDSDRIRGTCSPTTSLSKSSSIGGPSVGSRWFFFFFLNGRGAVSMDTPRERKRKRAPIQRYTTRERWTAKRWIALLLLFNSVATYLSVCVDVWMCVDVCVCVCVCKCLLF